MGTLPDKIRGIHGDGYDALRTAKPDDDTQRIASMIYSELSDFAKYDLVRTHYVPSISDLERAVRKVKQQLYVPGGDVETSKRLAERNAGLALEVERLKSQLQQQEEDMLRYDRFLDAVEAAIKTCQAEPSS